MPKIERPKKLDDLSVFVGVWNTVGEIAATSTSPAAQLLATDTYEWIPGGHFLLHRVDARMGEEVSRSIEIYAFDPEANAFRSRSYDDQGQTEEFRADLQEDSWTIVGETLRFSGRFTDNARQLAGRWQTRTETGWATLMDIELSRAS